jgi:drug/metabolite transporter (DMT)-like permease
MVAEGPGALLRLRADDVLAGVYLAVAVTAIAFVLWYSCVQRLGSARAGLLTGVAPIAAAAGGVALGGPVPSAPVWLGVAVVAAGLALGLRQGPAGRHGLRLASGPPGGRPGPRLASGPRRAEG